MATKKEEETLFETLSKIDVGEHIEHKNNLSYLSWTWAWAEFKKKRPDAHYEIWRDEQGRPYIEDPNLGYMVFTTITAGDETHTMWLPVMDYQNHAQKSAKYKLTQGRRTFDVEPATMFDINTALMRCLVKNIAMFGLGLYIYAGEDLPEEAVDDTPKSAPKPTPVKSASTSNSKPSTVQEDASTDADADERKKYRQMIVGYCREHKITSNELEKDYHVTGDSPLADLKRAYKELTTPPDEQTSIADEFAAIDERVPF